MANAHRREHVTQFEHTHKVIKPFPMTLLCAQRYEEWWCDEVIAVCHAARCLLSSSTMWIAVDAFHHSTHCIPVEKCFTLCTTGHFGYGQYETHIAMNATHDQSMQKCMKNKTTTTTTATSIAELFTAHQHLFLPFNQMCDLVPCFTFLLPLFAPIFSLSPPRSHSKLHSITQCNVLNLLLHFRFSDPTSFRGHQSFLVSNINSIEMMI